MAKTKTIRVRRRMSESSSQTRSKTIHLANRRSTEMRNNAEHRGRGKSTKAVSQISSVALRELKKMTPRRKNGKGPSV
jgi:hypothetical protein